MKSFAPLIGLQPHSLILGSMPSQISLDCRQYYANPNNAFWWIMTQIIASDNCLDYDRKTKLICDSGFAVWDVLASCQRKGSLDSNIQRSSETANDLLSLIQDNPSLRLIAFNGAAAKQIFMRYCSGILSQYPELRWRQLPSTSPAHAAMQKSEKLVIWRDALLAK
jgi:TDG/mug DNA glycosylase family protein